MRKVRSKTADPEGKRYLLKAKAEGIELSWNKYEQMLPQDGFTLLGLSCDRCLQGPCRLNPFREEEAGTVCGLNREQLVLSKLMSMVARDYGFETAYPLVELVLKRMEISLVDENALRVKAEEWGIDAGNKAHLREGLWKKAIELAILPTETDLQNGTNTLVAIATRRVEAIDFVNDLAELLWGKITPRTLAVGLGVLHPDYINVCMEGADILVLELAQEIAGELKDEAVKVGATAGFNIVLVGDLPSYQGFSAVSNQGTAELALLTGLVELYVVKGPGLGLNVAANYHTVVGACTPGVGKEYLRSLFIRAVAAYGKRMPEKIVPSPQRVLAISGYALDAEAVKAGLQQGLIKGVCVIGGGSNLKVTVDGVTSKLAGELADDNILNLTYGNAAVTLAKFGFLTESPGGPVANALGFTAGPMAYSVGGETQVVRLMDLVRKIGVQKVIAVFPELNGGRDLQVALAFACLGVKVVTSIGLPVKGSKAVAEQMDNLIEFCEPQAIAEKVMAFLNGY